MRRVPLPVALLIVAVMAAACGTSPASPSAGVPAAAAAGSAAQLSTMKGWTVNALTGVPLSSITVRLDEGASTTTALDGSFELSATESGLCAISVSGPGAVPRETQVTMPAANASLSLIPDHFDLAAFDEMARSTGALRRWTASPSLVIVDAVLAFTDVNASSFTALDEHLTPDERVSVMADLGWGLPQATGETFNAFASVTVESPRAGAVVDIFPREGQIVVARFRGLSRTGYVGYGRAASRDDQVVAGSLMLDRDFDAALGPSVRAIRVHELGHALGYMHVSKCRSFMNASGVFEPNGFDRDATRIAFLRAPGNTSPDRDPARTQASRHGGRLVLGPIQY